MKPADKKKVNKRVVFFAGKAAPACKHTINPWPETSWRWLNRLYCQAHHSPDRQRRQRHQCRSWHKRLSSTLLPPRLFCLFGRSSDSCFRYQSTYFDSWYWSFWDIKHEILPQRRVAFGDSRYVTRDERFRYILANGQLVDGANIEIAEEVGENNVCKCTKSICITCIGFWLRVYSLLRTLDSVSTTWDFCKIPSQTLFLLVPSKIYDISTSITPSHSRRNARLWPTFWTKFPVALSETLVFMNRMDVFLFPVLLVSDLSLPLPDFSTLSGSQIITSSPMISIPVRSYIIGLGCLLTIDTRHCCTGHGGRGLPR